MRQPKYATRFLKDVERCRKRGYRMDKLKAVMELLIDEQPLAAANREHALSGNYAGYRECHIAPDWLMIYDTDNDERIVFARTGTHSDLF